MNELADRLIADRKAKPRGEGEGERDLLDYMLDTTDPDGGQGLSDLNIRHQMLTFLIAGHETTSGLLSFALYYMMRNPEVMQRAREEVDQALGENVSIAPTQSGVAKLRYVRRILHETLRMQPTAPGFVLQAHQDTVIGGKYAVTPATNLVVSTIALHRDPEVFADPERFDPERFTAEHMAELPPNSYKPFGNGVRACIGQQFALLEATTVLGMLLQRFDFSEPSPYDLEIKETLTIKPEGFNVLVRPRPGRDVTAPAQSPNLPSLKTKESKPLPSSPYGSGSGIPLSVLYGSNLGTAQSLAREIADDASAIGYAVTIGSLDEHAGRLADSGVLVIVTASYNGQPPDNAVEFCNWLSQASLRRDELSGLKYCVFGCGDQNWAATFQAIPKLIDEQLEAYGAQRILEAGAGDASDDFDGQYRDWYDRLWPALAEATGAGSASAAPAVNHRFEVETLTEPVRQSFFASVGAHSFVVESIRELVGSNAGDSRSVKQIDLKIPAGYTYQVGDHLAILPRNSDQLVSRAAAALGVDPDTGIRLKPNTASAEYVPIDRPIAIGELLSGYLELQETATRAHIAKLAEYATDRLPELEALSGDDDESKRRYREEILAPRVSLIDLIERFPAACPPFNIALDMLPALKPRFYSISSSQNADSDIASLTVGVLNSPPRGGQIREYVGTTSNYLARQLSGSTVYGFIRKPGIPFTLPVKPQTPVIMVATGSGIAPFRGFLQERAVLAASGQQLGKAILFFGVRDTGSNLLYRDELNELASRAQTEVVIAASDDPVLPQAWVQDKVAERADQVWSLLESGATTYVCGDARTVAPAIRECFINMARNNGIQNPEDWMATMRDENRFLEDIWAAA